MNKYNSKLIVRKYENKTYDLLTIIQYNKLYLIIYNTI